VTTESAYVRPKVLERGDLSSGADAPAVSPDGSAALRSSPAERGVQIFLALVCAAALAAGVLLVPSPTGTGTHRVLGLPECGMLKMTGKPCPTCGVTTSFVLAAHGRFAESLVNQPFGFVLFWVVGGSLVGLVAALVRGRSVQPFFVRVSPMVILLALSALLLVSWMYKWSAM
jgi:hypothetical protein